MIETSSRKGLGMDRTKSMLGNASGLALAISSAAALTCIGGAAQADTLCIQNNAAFGNGPIVTVDCTTHTIVNSFIP